MGTPLPLKRPILGRQKGKWAVGFCYGFEILHGLLTNKIIRIPIKNYFGDPPTPSKKPILGEQKGKWAAVGDRNIRYDFLMVGGDALRSLYRNVCRKLSGARVCRVALKKLQNVI